MKIPTLNWKKRTFNQKLTIIGTICTVILAITAVLVFLFNQGVAFRLVPSAPAAKAMITFPSQYSVVNESQAVSGTSSNIPVDDVIWLVVKPSDCQEFWPQAASANIQSNGDWLGSTFISGTISPGVSYKIMAVLADPNTREAYNQWGINARAHSDPSGLNTLMGGKELYSIDVYRK